MQFQLKVKDQKNKIELYSFLKVETLRLMFDKIKFVARKVIHTKKTQINNIKNYSSIKFSTTRNFNIQKGSFLVKIINDSDKLINKVKKLRHESFFQQSEDTEFDSDEFDKYCDHLVVIDRSVSEEFVVGTYRLLLKPKYLEKIKFYSQSEFNIKNLFSQKKTTLLEAGRSCVHKNYRDGRIIKLLWRGLATYIINNQAELIFGCASFPSSNHRLFTKQLSYLYHYHRSPNNLKTSPHKDLKADFKIIGKDLIDSLEEFRKLPPLIKAYLRVGAWVGDGAIVDNKFNTTDVLIVLDSKKILKKYAQLSFKRDN